jgi:SSS family solute:Na+ symporter
MLHLSAIDGIAVFAFILAILALGFSAKLRDHSVLAYLVAGRNLSLPAFVATLVTTWYGGVLAVGDSVKLFGIGTILLFGVPYYVFALIYALMFAERVRGAEQISIPERLTQRFGRGAGLVSALLVFALAVPAAHVLMLGTLVQLMTGWSIAVCVVCATVGGTLFLYRGGLLADVRVGMLAFIMMYLGLFVVVGWCLVHNPPGEAFSHIDPSLLRIDGGQNWLSLISFFILGAWTLVDPGFHQRVSSAATPELGRKGVLISIGFWILFDILTTTTGLYALVTLKPDAGGLAFFPELGDKVLPPGLKALFLCGLFGTILSALVGYSLVSGATFGREFVLRLNPKLSDHQVKAWTRVGIALACVVSVLLAINVSNVVKDLWYYYSGALVGALILPVCFAYLPKLKLNASSKWVAASMIVAFAVSFGWMIGGKRTNNDDLLVYIGRQKFSLGTLAPGLAVSAAVLGLGEAIGRRQLKND